MDPDDGVGAHTVSATPDWDGVEQVERRIGIETAAIAAAILGFTVHEPDGTARFV